MLQRRTPQVEWTCLVPHERLWKGLSPWIGQQHTGCPLTKTRSTRQGDPPLPFLLKTYKGKPWKAHARAHKTSPTTRSGAGYHPRSTKMKEADVSRTGSSFVVTCSRTLRWIQTAWFASNPFTKEANQLVSL